MENAARTDVNKDVSPRAGFASVGSDALYKEPLEIRMRMESLKDLCAQRVGRHASVAST